MDRQHLGAKSLASAPAATRVVAEWSPITSVERNGGRGRLSQTDLETWEVQDSQFLNVYLYILQYFQLVVGDPWRQRVSRSRESKEKGFIRKARRACGYEVPKTETYQDPFSDQCYHERKLIWRQHRTPTEKPLVTLVTKNDLRISGDPPKRVRESNRD